MQKSLVALAVGATFAASGAVMAATTLTWDSSASSPTAPVDGPGTWSAASGAYANWSNGTTDVAWNNTSDSGYTAAFGNSTPGDYAGPVTLGSNITVGGLVSNAAYNSNYTIASSGSYGLTLTSPSVVANAAFTLSANTTFQQGLDLTGGQTLTLTGTNTNTTGTTVSAGTLSLVTPDNSTNANFSGALGTGPVSVNSGAVLSFLSNDSIGTVSNNITFVGNGVGNGAVNFTGNSITYNVTGPMTAITGGSANNAQIMVFGIGTTANLNGVISGGGNLVVNGQGGGISSKQNITFGAAETYTGSTLLYSYNATTLETLNGGINTLPVGTTLTLASSISGGSINPLTLDLHGNNQQVAMFNGVTVAGNSGTITVEDSTDSGATLTMTGTGPGTSKPGTVAAYANIASGGTLNLLTNFTDSSPNDGVAVYNGTTVNLASGVTFSVPLNLYLAANNTNGTVNLNGGTLISNAISTAGTGVATINLDGTLATTENSPVTGNTWIFPNITLNVLSQGVTLNVASGVQSVVYSPFLQGPSNSTGGVTVTGGGTVIMDGGNNTYVGATNIAAGTTLTLAAPASTTSGGTTSTTPGGTITGTSALTIASGGTLNLANTDAGNKVIIDYGSGSSPNSAIQAYVASGAITTASGYAVGYADGADGVVSGLSAGQEEIMATLPGDTNLAGTVNLGDVSTVYNNVGITSGATWDQGDFTASGAVTLGDLTSTYNNVGLSLASGPVSAGTASTAQPMAAVMARTLVAASTNTSTTPSVSDVTLTVNKATGDAMLVFANPSAQFYAWEITSTTGGLNYANLTDIPNFGTGLHARGPTALDGVYSGFATGGYDNPGGTWNLGDIITPGDITSGALDFSFNEFNPSTGLSVTFDPGTINYTAVPEPATLGLLALGGLAMLSLKRKRRRA
jgi:autotransporter-associated beta strand protein